LASSFLDRLELQQNSSLFLPNRPPFFTYFLKTVAKMITDVVFDTPIGGEYKRNNRSTRQKSLRCFPSCGIKGHVPGGFCGLPLKVTIEVARESNDLDFDVKNYLFIAEIRPVSQPRISAAMSISEADLLRQIRTKEKSETYGELFQADSTIHVEHLSGDIWQVELTFNSHHCSWDYAWKSNRWSGPQEQHVVDIIILKTASASEHRVVSSRPSNPFVVSSSHKKPQKTSQVKVEGEDETICLPTKNKNISRIAAGGVDDEDERVQFTTAKTSFNLASRVTRELRCSDDNKALILTPIQPEDAAEASAAATLIALMSGTSSSDAAAAPTAQKEKKSSASPEKRPQKRSRTEGVPMSQQLMDMRAAYPYRYPYPVGLGRGPASSASEGMPPFWGAYPFPSPYPYPSDGATNYAHGLPFPCYPYLMNQTPDLHYMHHCPDPYQPGLRFDHSSTLSSHSDIDGMQGEVEEAGEGEDREDREVRPVEVAAVVGEDSDGSPTSSAKHIPVAIAKPVLMAVAASVQGERRAAASAKRAQSLMSSGLNGSGDVPHTRWDGRIRDAPSVPLIPSLLTSVGADRAFAAESEARVDTRPHSLV